MYLLYIIYEFLSIPSGFIDVLTKNPPIHQLIGVLAGRRLVSHFLIISLINLRLYGPSQPVPLVKPAGLSIAS